MERSSDITETDFTRTTGMPMQYLYRKLKADPKMKPTRAQTQGFLGEYRLASLLAPLMKQGASLWNSLDCGFPLGDVDHVITVVRPDTVDIVVMVRWVQITEKRDLPLVGRQTERRFTGLQFLRTRCFARARKAHYQVNDGA